MLITTYLRNPMKICEAGSKQLFKLALAARTLLTLERALESAIVPANLRQRGEPFRVSDALTLLTNGASSLRARSQSQRL